MRKCSKILIIIIFTLFIPIFQSLAVSNDTGVILQVTGVPPVCDNDGVCDAGEDATNCPADCGCDNNGICEAARGEDSNNCPLDCPATVIYPSIGEADFTPPTIYNLRVKDITLISAVIEWEVTEYALCQLFWGKTIDYKEGVILEKDYTPLKHSTSLTGLSSDTLYHFKVNCRDRSSNELETRDQKFTTLSPPDFTPPANVLNFEAITGDGKIELKWENPSDPDFKGVRIIRNDKFYPSDPWTGDLIYDGKETSFLDAGLTNGMRYYYTAFAYDKAGNYSSGAIVSAVPQRPLLPGEIPPEIIPPPEEILPEIPPPPEIEKLTLDDFDFIQGGEKVPIIEGKIEIRPGALQTISIDYEKVPEVLKTIMVTMEKDGKFFSFLLRINKEKTAYLATLVPPESGMCSLTLTILDYKNQALKKIPGQLIVKETEVPSLPIPWYEKNKNWLTILIISFSLFAITYFIRKKMKEKRKI